MKNTPIDPQRIPQRTLYTGVKMPGVGMGTFGSDRFTAEDIAHAVKGAAKLGYRLFDGASVYGNENLIGKVYEEILKSGIKRDELFITSKVWNDQHDHVIESCKQTLKDLRLDYLDCYFVHWPFPNFHAKGVSVDSRDPNAKPYIHEDFMKTWHQMEKLVDMGLVKHIGTSSMTIPKLKLILRDARIKPAVNEMELHPCFQQAELYQYCKNNGIEVIGFCPIGSPTRPDRDKTDQDIADIEEPIVLKIAKAHHVHPAVICVKWGIQHGHSPIPFSIHENEYYSNLVSAIEDPLTAEEMKELEAADKNCRLIKGQVFLWEGAKDWKDLWDLNGIITV
jgi:alcohol dehydrogenase (NADP+)